MNSKNLKPSGSGVFKKRRRNWDWEEKRSKLSLYFEELDVGHGKQEQEKDSQK
jgi:hypothetical protein